MKTRNDHNITRASRTANKQHNRGSNRAARRNAARLLASVENLAFQALLEEIAPLDADAVRAYVAAKYPDAMASPVAVACREVDPVTGIAHVYCGAAQS